MAGKKLTMLFLGNIESPHTAKWVQYFADNGHNVHLVSYVPASGIICQTTNINLHLIKRKIPINIWPFNTILNFPFTLLKINKLIGEISPDIIHAHYVTSYGHLAAFTGMRPFVLTAWGSDILVTPKEYWLAKKIVKYVLRKADYITCDAGHMKNAMIDLGADSSKIGIINFGVDTRKFISGVRNDKLKSEIGFSFKNKIVISLRSLEQIYNIENLIKAIPEIIKSIPETRFIIIGSGTKEEELKKMADKLCPKGSFRFIGRVKNDDLPKYLNISDVYVSTSLSDGGIAASTAEAMACEVPVVITDSADNRNWVTDGVNGFIVPVRNSEMLKKKVCQFLVDGDLRKKIGKAGRDIIIKKNDYYNEMSKVEKIYYSLINKI